MDKTYKNNKIKKFLFRIDFVNEIIDLKESIPSKITSKIVKNFPNSVMSDLVKSEIHINNDLIRKKDEPFKQWEYISVDGSNKIVITPKFLAYDCNKYLNFQDVQNNFLPVIEEILKISNVQIGRTEINYVNVFLSNEFRINKIDDWKKYFDSKLLSFSSFGDNENKITNMVNSIEFAYPDFRVRFKCGFNNRNYPIIASKPDFITECDGYSNAVIISFDDLKKSIVSIHDELEKIFEKSVSDNMRNVLNEQ